MLQETLDDGWPRLLPSIIQLLGSNDVPHMSGALNALSKICEDSPDMLEYSASNPLNVILPMLISFVTHQEEQFRKYSLSCINRYIIKMPDALAAQLDRFLQGLFQLVHDKSSAVRKLQCQAHMHTYACMCAWCMNLYTRVDFCTVRVRMHACSRVIKVLMPLSPLFARGGGHDTRP